jgi:hypothetical protein
MAIFFYVGESHFATHDLGLGFMMQLADEGKAR